MAKKKDINFESITTYFLGYFILWAGVKTCFFILYQERSYCLFLNLFDYPIVLFPVVNQYTIAAYQLFYAGMLMAAFLTLGRLETKRRKVVMNYLHE